MNVKLALSVRATSAFLRGFTTLYARPNCVPSAGEFHRGVKLALGACAKLALPRGSIALRERPDTRFQRKSYV